MTSSACLSTTYKTAARCNERPPLTVNEKIAFECLKQIAAEGRCATQAELCAAVGVGYQQGTMPAMLQRMERKGYITRTVFQRGMIVCLTDLGICTAPPKDQSPHWRDRPKADPVPTPAIHLVRNLPIAAQLEQDARAEGKTLAEHLMNLIYIGHHGYRAEREEDR